MIDPLLYPQSSEEAATLRSSIESLLQSIPDRWSEVAYDELTAIEQRSLSLLYLAGMVERRAGLHISLFNNLAKIEIEFSATGEYGVVEALEPAIRNIYSDLTPVIERWYLEHAGNEVPLIAEPQDKQLWRLTDQGVLARNDLSKSAKERDFVFSYVLRLGIQAYRDPCRGYGKVIRYQKSEQSNDGNHAQQVPVFNVGNWDEGAAAIAAKIKETIVNAFNQMFGRRASKGKSETQEPTPRRDAKEVFIKSLLLHQHFDRDGHLINPSPLSIKQIISKKQNGAAAAPSGWSKPEVSKALAAIFSAGGHGRYKTLLNSNPGELWKIISTN